MILALLAALFHHRSTRQEQAQIQSQYDQMRVALSANDTNAVLALIAPQHRAGFNDHMYYLLDSFAKPLGPQSSITVWRDEASVWPVRTSHFLVIPGGHTIEMTKVDGTWFFTGKVHID